MTLIDRMHQEARREPSFSDPGAAQPEDVLGLGEETRRIVQRHHPLFVELGLLLAQEKVLKTYAGVGVLLIDELGYCEVEPVQAGYFFTLMQQRHKRTPTLITSNLGFGEWKSFLRNDHLTAALIDRLTETSHVFNMKECRTIREKLPQEE